MRRAALAATLAVLASAAVAEARDVQIRGTAYEFNNSGVRLAGAVIRVAEYPRLRTTAKRDGTYALRVPDRANVTPYVAAPGYHTIHLQTFRTSGEDLERVNFQTPTEAVYRAFTALLGVPLDPGGGLRATARSSQPSAPERSAR